MAISMESRTRYLKHLVRVNLPKPQHKQRQAVVRESVRELHQLLTKGDKNAIVLGNLPIGKKIRIMG